MMIAAVAAVSAFFMPMEGWQRMARWGFLAAVLLLVVLYRRHSVLMLKGSDLRYLIPSPEILRPLIFRGIPMSLQMFIMSAAGMTMLRLFRLSVSPITPDEWKTIRKLGGDAA